jgi:glycosyltransferase involved in cell wall biosynthesis
VTPRVSVIVPCFNYAQTLGETLQSVLAQTLPEWECIVVDDGSTDDTRGAVAAFAARDARIRYLRQENRGPAAARNRGIEAAAGRYLQFLDADDLLAPDKLAVQASSLDAHPGVDIVIGPATFFRTSDPDTELYSLHGHLSRPMAPRISGTAEALQLLEHFNIMVTPAPLVRRSVVVRHGGFNEAMHGSEDWDLWLRCALAGAGFAYLDHPHALARIRTHGASASRSTARMTRGLIDGTRTFRGPQLPRIYELAAGIGAVVDDNRRLHGARQILRAARRATVTVSRVRWLVSGIAALLLPRRLFWWLVTRPMPERGLELLRKLRRTPPASAR